MPRRPPRSPRWLPNPAWLIASLALMLAVAVPIAYVAMPGMYRWHTLNHLLADDLAARERALNYVIRRAAEEPAVREGAVARLERIDPHDQREHFVQLVNALDHAGVWSRRHVGDDPWLHWIGVLAAAPEPAARRLAAEQLSHLHDLSHGESLRELLDALLDDEEPTVRHDALRTAALLLPYTDDASHYERMIGSRAGDAAPEVARDAWMLLGLIEPAAGYQANWRIAPPTVAEALLWAAVKANPEHPQPALDALRDVEAPPAARAMAAYALHLSEAEVAHRALYDLLAQRPIAHEPGPARHVLKRAILAVPLPETHNATEPHTEAEHLLDPLCDELEALPFDALTAARPLLAACHSRRPPTIRARMSELLADVHERPVPALALIEGLPVGAYDLPLTSADPAMLRLMAAARTAQPDIAIIDDLFSHEQSPMRDLACVVAADRFDDDRLDEFVHELLTDLNPEARISGAILVGLTGLHLNLLEELAEAERNWRVQTLMHVGLWMHDTRPEMTRRMAGLLMREDLPMSTLLLAMLHRRDARAWDFLLAPHGEPAPDLHRLLTHYRWWHVLARYLPADAPPFWLWADADLQRFQIDVLRNWYLLHRSAMTDAS